MEYEQCLEILTDNDRHKLLNLLVEDNPGKELITYGDTGVNERGIEYPLDTTLTVVEE